MRIQTKFGLNDITLVPAVQTTIRSRSECSTGYPYHYYDKETECEKKMLPIFTAPMTSVVNTENRKVFEDYGIIPIIPDDGNTTFDDLVSHINKGHWVALNLDHFKALCDGWYRSDLTSSRQDNFGAHIHILIDVANGHMSYILDLVKSFKKRYPQAVLMAGNIANPWTYLHYAFAKIDYIRVGIGGGRACTTSVYTGVHYPLGSLLHDINRLKHSLLVKLIRLFSPKLVLPKVIADGGLSDYSHCIKALALGADYVMLGKMLVECWESAAPKECYAKHTKTYFKPQFESYDPDIQTWAEYFGMSTIHAQKSRNQFGILRPAEGIHTKIKVTKNLKQFTSEFKHFLSSAISYTNAKTLEQFCGKCKFIRITPTVEVNYKLNKSEEYDSKK